MSGNGRNMYVFRDGRCAVSGRLLVAALAAKLRNLSCVSALLPKDTASRDALIDLLLRSGELECALTDAGAREARSQALLTDLLARLLVGAACSPPTVEQMLALLPDDVPGLLSVSPPEGFAFCDQRCRAG